MADLEIRSVSNILQLPGIPSIFSLIRFQKKFSRLKTQNCSRNLSGAESPFCANCWYLDFRVFEDL